MFLFLPVIILLCISRRCACLILMLDIYTLPPTHTVNYTSCLHCAALSASSDPAIASVVLLHCHPTPALAASAS
jgi:hypothetical protein